MAARNWKIDLRRSAPPPGGLQPEPWGKKLSSHVHVNVLEAPEIKNLREEMTQKFFFFDPPRDPKKNSNTKV